MKPANNFEEILLAFEKQKTDVEELQKIMQTDNKDSE